MKKKHLFISLLFTQLIFSQEFTQNTVGLIPDGYPRGLEVADFNNDNHLDVLIIDISGITEIVYWLGDGSGGFGSKILVDNDLTISSGHADDIAVLDVNNDGFLDIVVAASINYQDKSLRYPKDKILWYPNNQDGTFGSRVILDDGGNRSNHIVIFDADNNGFDDIIIGDRYSNTAANYSIYYLPNQGDNTFGAKVFVVNILYPGELRGLSSGFLNKDGLEDLVYTDDINNTVNAVFNNGDGTFGNSVSINISDPYFVTTGNINGASNDEILVSKYNLAETLSWYHGDGSFGNQSIISDQEVDAIINSTISDIDNDGDNDIFSAIQMVNGEYGFVWFENDGNGNFSGANLVGNSSNTSYDIKTGDINEDGKLDVILSNRGGVYWYENNLTLSTNNFDLSDNIQIYPNPSTNVIHINQNNQSIDKIEIIDLKGNIILSKFEEFENINVNHLSLGIYILKIYAENNIMEKKLIKN
jgi:hypothetical protein